MSQTNEHSSVWDCIPPEVRNRIYEECANLNEFVLNGDSVHHERGPIKALRRTFRTFYQEIAGYEGTTTSLSIKDVSSSVMVDKKDLMSLMRSYRGAYKNIKHVTLRSDMPLPQGLEELPALETVIVKTSPIIMSSTSSLEPPNNSRLVFMAYGQAHRAIDRLKPPTMTSPVTILVRLWIQGWRCTSNCVSGGIEKSQYTVQWEMRATVNVTERMVDYKTIEWQSNAHSRDG